MRRPCLSDLRGFFEVTRAVIDKEALVETEELGVSKDMKEGPKSESDGQVGACEHWSKIVAEIEDLSEIWIGM